jgi:hypothetical protein
MAFIYKLQATINLQPLLRCKSQLVVRTSGLGQFHTCPIWALLVPQIVFPEFLEAQIRR